MQGGGENEVTILMIEILINFLITKTVGKIFHIFYDFIFTLNAPCSDSKANNAIL